ncbi:MAG: hypothetical protein JKY87_04180 [Mariprofundus sp.]|nr:hypothetical protein [Mariprofundus sp.]
MIDMMGNTTFTNHEISARVVALIRQEYTLDSEQKISRIATGSLQGTYMPSISEKQSITDYQAHIEACIKIGADLAANNNLLIAAIAYERAMARIAIDPLDNAEYPDYKDYKDENGKTTKNSALLLDGEQRISAQALIDNTGAEVLSVAGARLKQREAEMVVDIVA